MAKQSLNTIKNWFKTRLKPTQAQFWDTWDSFWHKDDSIPTTSVTNLDNILNSKASTQSFTNLQTSVGQSITEIVNEIVLLADNVAGKVDSEEGKQLSTEDFTTPLKEKLEGIDMGTKMDKNGRLVVLDSDVINMDAGEIFTKTLDQASVLTIENPVLAKEILLIIDGNYSLTLPGLQMGASLDYNGLSKNYITLKCTSIDPEPQFMIWDIDREKIDIQKDIIEIVFGSRSQVGFRIYTSNYNNVYVDWVTSGYKAISGGGELVKTSNCLETALILSDIGSVVFISDLGASSNPAIIELDIIAPNLREINLGNTFSSVLEKFNNSTTVINLSSFPEIKHIMFSFANTFLSIDISTCTKLQSFSTESGGYGLDIYTDVILPYSVPSSVEYHFQSTALSEIEVNRMLIFADTNWAIPTGFKLLQLGGAAPTGNGLLAKNSLLAKGWTIITT